MVGRAGFSESEATGYYQLCPSTVLAWQKDPSCFPIHQGLQASMGSAKHVSSLYIRASGKASVDESVNKLASLCRNLANTTVQGLSKFVIY